MLFLEFHGTDASVAEQSQRFGEIAAELGGGPFDWATRSRGSQPAVAGAARRLLGGHAAAAGHPQALSTDVCVPISRLAECVDANAARLPSRAGLIAPIVGHVGDGNFHMLLLIDHNDRRRDRARRGFARAPGRPRAGDGRHLHRRARHRPGQDEISAGRARRTGARCHARDQARARSARHPESGQDFRVVILGPHTSSPPGLTRWSMLSCSNRNGRSMSRPAAWIAGSSPAMTK